MRASADPGEVDFDSQLVEEVLGEYGAMARAAMESYLPDGEPNHLYALLGDYPRRGGKMLRPALCIAMARATGARVEDAIHSAVAIELLHNAILIHDDVEDASEARRGRPTLHALHGASLAINAGDAVGLLSLGPLKHNFALLGVTTAMRIFEETERVAWESAEGQALELGWTRDNRVDLTDEDYLRMVLQKTCWLMAIHPLRVGCLIGAGDRARLDPLIRLGFFFGAAFQIQDDVLNLEPGENYGKELNGDLCEGKRTLMVLHTLRSAGPRDRERLTTFLGAGRSGRSDADVAWARELINRTGGLPHARIQAQALAGAALCEFDDYFGGAADSRDHRFIRDLIPWVMRRTH